MASVRPTVPGIERSFGSAPSDDSARGRGAEPLRPQPLWTDDQLVFSGHRVQVDMPTGAVSVAATDAALAYHATPLAVVRTLNVAEQYAQRTYLDAHPNVDPEYHFFANWQLGQEANPTETWHETIPELALHLGSGSTYHFGCDEPVFATNRRSRQGVVDTLRAFGVPLRTLDDVGWEYRSASDLLRTTQGPFAVATIAGHPVASLVDRAAGEIHVFHPITGSAMRCTSRYHYDDHVGADGLREVNVAYVVDRAVDALGHGWTFGPVASSPPYRSYLLADDTGRGFELRLDATVGYLDGWRTGGSVRCAFVSTVVERSLPAPRTLEYNYTGDLLTRVRLPSDAGERAVTYAYDDRGILRTITDEMGRSVSLGYVEDAHDADSRLLPRLKVSRISDASGNWAGYSYDTARCQVEVTFGTGEVVASRTVYSYDEEPRTSQRVVVEESTTVTRGQPAPQPVRTRLRYSRDGHLNLLETVHAVGASTQQKFNDFNQVVAHTDALGHRREVRYDVRDAPRADDPHRYDLVATHEDTVDDAGNAVAVDTAADFVRYDAQSSDFAADSTQSTHRVARFADEIGSRWSFAYDDAGQGRPLTATRVTDPLGVPTDTEVDARGAVTSQVNALGMRTVYSYDDRGRLVSLEGPNGEVSSWRYGTETGWLEAATDALGASVADPDHSMRFERNGCGQVLRTIDPVGDVIEYGYDEAGRLATVDELEPAVRRTTFETDAQGRVVVVTDPGGLASRFLFDEAGRMYRTVGPDGREQRFGYDASSRLAELTDNNSAVTHYAYDLAGRLRRIEEPDGTGPGGTTPGRVVNITLDPLGRRLQVEDTSLGGLARYSYDAAGRLLTHSDPWGYVLSYEYDARGDLISVTDAAGDVATACTRDVLGRVDVVTDSATFDPAERFVYTYTRQGRVGHLYGIEVPSVSLTAELDYDVNGRLIEVRHAVAGVPLLLYGYERRNDGRIGAFHGDRTGLVRYDGRKQLVGEQDAGVRSGYDARGNRRWRAPTEPPSLQVFDDANRLLTAPGLDAEFEYDTNGCLTAWRSLSDGSETALHYDGVDRLVAVETAGSTVSYLYDADGLLLQRRVESVAGTEVRRYRYAGRSLVAEVDESGGLLELHTVDPDGRRLRRRTATPLDPAGHTLFPLVDGLGDVVGHVDAAGALRASVLYDAWGTPTVADPDGLRGVFGYRGGYTDETSGLIHFGLRWYAPALGRWVSQDPLLAALDAPRTAHLAEAYEELSNLYRYVGNDPVNEVDPLGLGKGKIVIRVLRWIRGGSGRGRLGRASGQVSEGKAVRIVGEGGHVRVTGGSEHQRRQVARQIAEHASPEGRAVHAPPHGPGQSPHYHPAAAGSGQGAGHVLYGLTGLVTAEHWLGDTWYATAIDFVNPLSLGRDVMDLGAEIRDMTAGDDVYLFRNYVGQ